jgi:hypothetical protein
MTPDELDRLALWSAVRRYCSFKQRIVLWSIYGAGRSVHETARRHCNGNKGSASIYVHRGLAKLRKCTERQALILEHALWIRQVLGAKHAVTLADWARDNRVKPNNVTKRALAALVTAIEQLPADIETEEGSEHDHAY